MFVVLCASNSGLFEVRAREYLKTLPEAEPSGVNKFLKGLSKFDLKENVICSISFILLIVTIYI